MIEYFIPLLGMMMASAYIGMWASYKLGKINGREEKRKYV